jgi:hypothetical protein
MSNADLFTRRLPKIFSFLTISGYPKNNLSEVSLAEFKKEVDVIWADRLGVFQQARTNWSKAHLELLRLEGAKVPNVKALEAKTAEVAKLRSVFDVTFELMLNGRRAEEIARVLSSVYAGDKELTHWFEVQLRRVEAYTPQLPA